MCLSMQQQARVHSDADASMNVDSDRRERLSFKSDSAHYPKTMYMNLKHDKSGYSKLFSVLMDKYKVGPKTCKKRSSVSDSVYNSTE